MNQNRENRKGQSAIEYLTTYGWMLLVVATVGGAIFTTVQDSSQVQSVSGLNNAEVQVDNYGLNEEGLQLEMRAASSNPVDIENVEIIDPETGITAEVSPSEVVPVGETTQLNLKDVQATETSDTYLMKITYDTGGLEGLTVEGSIKGSMDVFNRLELANASFNRSTNKLQVTVENKGDNTTDSIDYIVEAGDKNYTGSLSSLNAGDTVQINVSTDETYPLEAVNLDISGFRFVDSSSGIKCTPTEGLVGYWTFNDEQTKNDRIMDLSGQKNNGSLENGVKTGRGGKIGDAYRFDGSDDWVSVPHDESIGNETRDSLTVITRIKGYDITNTRWLEKAGSYFLMTTSSDGNKPDFLVKPDNNVVQANNPISDDKWYQIAGVWNGSSQQMKILIGGEYENNESVSFSEIEDKQGLLNIGRSDNGIYFDGKIDETRIYNKSLSKTKIQRLHSVKSKEWAVSGCKLTG